ncbi:MAG TPA: metal ABC transporter ATP-binding protein [Thermoanaerobacterales bacterium]|jgi:zinc transport system ATP-binding protein|nr:metal ABC transporter ATP-binding protein [Thermoanaerobacterales bacterium]
MLDIRNDPFDLAAVENKEVIGLTKVSFSYDGKPVLKDVNLSVKTGDFLTVLGPNGSAKSTLLKVMLGLLTPKTGEVKIFGQKVRQFKDWNKIGYISQQAANINTSFPATVEEVVSSAYYTGFGRIFDGAERKEAVKRALDAVGITALSHRLIGRLSGGQRQKVFLARALVRKPQTLFLDEPTTGIDAASQQEFYELISNFHKNNMTIVMITHDMEAAVKRATKVAYMRDGKVNLDPNPGNFSEKLPSILIEQWARGQV